jgi:hypothetical protein
MTEGTGRKIEIVNHGYKIKVTGNELDIVRNLPKKIEDWECELDEVETILGILKNRMVDLKEYSEDSFVVKETKWLISKYTIKKELLETEIKTADRECEYYRLLEKINDREEKEYQKASKPNITKYIRQRKKECDEHINIEKFYVSPEEEKE